jgi:hypothetical protein
MKTLPEKLQKNGFEYTLVQRTSKRGIYTQHVSQDCYYFEVFIIKTRKAGTFKGKPIPEREIYPSDECFGKSAWTCQTYEKAVSRFNSLPR